MRMKKMLNNEANVNAPMKTTRDNDNPANVQRLNQEGIAVVAPRAVVIHQEKVRRLHEQTRHLPKIKQDRRISIYSSRWKILATVLCLCASAGHAATSPSGTIQAGGTIRDSADTQHSIVSLNGMDAMPTDAVGFSVHHVGDTRGLRSCGPYANYTVTTSDGYVGVSIAPDVVMGLTGTAEGTYTTGAGFVNRSVGSWGDKGQYSVTPSLPDSTGTWCGGVVTQRVAIMPWKESNNPVFKGTYFIHAGPQASAGTYPTPRLELARLANPQSATPMVLEGTITVQDPTDCTVSLQNPTVDFGTVQQNSGIDVLLGYFPSNLNINCSLVNGGTGTNTAAMAISFTGTSGRWTDTLALQGTEGQGTLAEVRGVRATGTGSCDNNADRIQYQGQQYSIGNVGVGLTSIPLTWSLCSTGTGGMGTGTAQATVTLTWP